MLSSELGQANPSMSGNSPPGMFGNPKQIMSGPSPARTEDCLPGVARGQSIPATSEGTSGDPGTVTDMLQGQTDMLGTENPDIRVGLPREEATKKEKEEEKKET